MNSLRAEDFNDEIGRLVDQINWAKKYTPEENLEHMYAELLQLVINQGCTEVDPCARIHNSLKGKLSNDGFKTTNK